MSARLCRSVRPSRRVAYEAARSRYSVMASAQKIVDGGRGGSIVRISSAAGIKVQPFMVHYTASKHAITGMARAFAAELGKYSIRVNSVHPGPVNTPMGSGDIADVVLWLATDESKNVTAARISVDQRSTQY